MPGRHCHCEPGAPRSMREIASGLVVFVLLCTSAGLGILIRPRLPEHHRTRETVELTQITIGLLVAFAAVVLGLLTASVKHGYDSAAQDRQHYALQLTMLDQCLRDYGPDAAKIRVDIQSYTAAVIASTWPDEPPPTGVQYPDVTSMPRVNETHRSMPCIQNSLHYTSIDSRMSNMPA